MNSIQSRSVDNQYLNQYMLSPSPIYYHQRHQIKLYEQNYHLCQNHTENQCISQMYEPSFHQNHHSSVSYHHLNDTITNRNDIEYINRDKGSHQQPLSSYYYPQNRIGGSNSPYLSTIFRHHKNNDNNSKCNSYDSDAYSMSQLINHAHGPPILLSNRHASEYNARFSRQQNQLQISNKEASHNQRVCLDNSCLHFKLQDDLQRSKMGDENMINKPMNNVIYDSSEPSSGTNVYEVNLPRIIKPRKRKKRNRKTDVICNVNINKATNINNNNDTPNENRENNCNTSTDINKIMSNNNSTMDNHCFINYDEKQIKENCNDHLPCKLLINKNNCSKTDDKNNNIKNVTCNDNNYIELLPKLSNMHINIENLISDTNYDNFILSETNENIRNCSCYFCDPFSHIWSFPYSDNISEAMTAPSAT